MSSLCALSDAELVKDLRALVQSERHAMVDVIEHLVEVERRRLYLGSKIATLYRYCIAELGYDEHAALKRNRVAKLALRLPQVLDELRAGSMQLTGLFLLSNYLRGDNVGALLGEARGKSRRQIEDLIARRFPRPDVPSSLEPMAPRHPDLKQAEQLMLAATVAAVPTCSRAGASVLARLEPLSPSRLRVEFTARAELYDKVQKARELLSHALPTGDLGELFERALDALLENEARKRFGAGRPRKTRALKAGSRHVPVNVARAVWERDGCQCTFIDGEGHRCPERRFLTLEHCRPFALGGPPTLENLCLLCGAHNLESARQVFGEAQIEAKIHESRVLASLCSLGFARSEASAVLGQVLASEPGVDVEQLLRKSLLLLVPKAS